MIFCLQSKFLIDFISLDMNINIVAIVPARGGSKGLVKKNKQLICGHPMIAYAIKAAREAKKISRVVVATDDQQIAFAAQEYGADVPFLLPDHLTGDSVRLEDTFAFVAKELRKSDSTIDYICFIDPTRPVRLPGYLDQAIDEMEKGEYDSVISGMKEHKSIWKKTGDGLERLDSGFTVRQLKKDEIYVCSSGLITCTKISFMEKGERLGHKILIHEFTDHNMSVDVHSADDLRLAELILSEWKDRYIRI